MVDMPDDRVEGRAQGIRDVRELKRYGGGKGNCRRFLHFLDPNHHYGSATRMQSACRRSCSGCLFGALVRHSNVSDNAFMDQIGDGRRIRLGQQGVGSCTRRVGVRPVTALVKQLR